MSQWSKQWLEEVVPFIITPAEKEVFKSLPNEIERGKFIESFWQKRDPNPNTPENEFKLEYYRRIAAANKFFGTSTLSGWRSDRGRIYILLGPPREIQRDLTPASSIFSVSQAAVEVWSYMGLPSRNLPYHMEFTFVDKFGTGDYVLSANLGLGEAGDRPIDISSMHYHFDYIENLAAAMNSPFENLKKLEGIITTQVTYDLIPLQNKIFFLKGAQENTYIPIVVDLPYSDLPYKMIENRYYYSLTVIINISDKLGQAIYQMSREISFNHSQTEYNSLNSTSLQYQTFLQLEPESYKIHLLISDNFSGKIGTLHQELTVPSFRMDKLTLSDLVLSRKAYTADKKSLKSKNAGLEKINSEISTIFRQDERLNLYFEIYNLALNPKTGLNDFSIEYLFFRDEELVDHIPPAKSEPKSQDACRVQMFFELKNYQPGEYSLKIKITDNISDKFSVKETRFIITD